MAYVYLHIRLDTNEVFYVGIGSQPNHARAYFKSNRPDHWSRIVNKAGYDVQIKYDNISWEDAKIKETELIAFYGRLDKKNGTLINLTDGGDGILGNICTEERKIKISKKQIGKSFSDEHRKKLSAAKKDKRRQPHSEETKRKMSEAAKGRTFTDEHKINLKISHIGYKCSPESSEKKRLAMLEHFKSKQTA